MGSFRLNLRLRIALAFALVCIAAVGTLGVTFYTASRDMESAVVEQILSEEIDFLIERHRNRPDYLPSKGANLEYFIVRTAEDAVQLPRGLRELTPGKHAVIIDRVNHHVAVRHVDDTHFFVVYEVGQHEERKQRFNRLLLLSVGAVAAIGLALGFWLAGVLTRQLTDLAGRVARLSPDEPHGPLAQLYQDAEVEALARAIDGYQTRITRLIKHEQEFTANASHELRTPLTAIRTSCELLLAGSPLQEKERARVQMIDKAAHRMAEQLQTLLFIARERALSTIEMVALAECVSDAVESYRGEIARKGLVFDIEIDTAVVLNINRQALHTVLTNLIQNAIQHTERGFIRVSFDAHRLTVTDSGRGIAPETRPRIFERFYRSGEGPEGFGLGLAIVKQICDRNGWQIEVATSPTGGADLIVTFP